MVRQKNNVQEDVDQLILPFSHHTTSGDVTSDIGDAGTEGLLQIWLFSILGVQ
jgi:hypothetical protein